MSLRIDFFDWKGLIVVIRYFKNLMHLKLFKSTVYQVSVQNQRKQPSYDLVTPTTWY